MITLSSLNAACSAFAWAGKANLLSSPADRTNFLQDLRNWQRNDDVAPHLGRLDTVSFDTLSEKAVKDALNRMAIGILRPVRDDISGLLSQPNVTSIAAMESIVAGFVEDTGSRQVLLDGTTTLVSGIFEGLQSIREAMESGALDFTQTTPATVPIRERRMLRTQRTTHTVNTVAESDEAVFPGGEEAITMTQKLTNVLRWNVYAIVAGAQVRYPGQGGHISTFASNADFLTVMLLQFVHRGGVEKRNDHLWIQGHDSPGIYALLYVMGVITEEQLLRFRREAGYENEDGSITIDEGEGKGTCSYPHPMAMHDIWENPSVVMGAAGLNPVHKLMSDAYLQDHGLLPAHVDGHENRSWVVLGDASMREPEIIDSAMDKAVQHRLKVRHVVNLNLQGLDGIVDGDGNANFRQTLINRYGGAGWKVVEVIFDGHWDRLLEKDTQGLIKKRLDELNDGALYNLQGQSAAYFRKNFFGKKGTGPFDQQEDNPELLALLEAAGFTDEDIATLGWGGHDLQKIYNGFLEADKADGPALLIFRTVKGKSMGKAEAAITTHGFKGYANKREFHEKIADTLEVGLRDDQLRQDTTALFPFLQPRDLGDYAWDRRKALGGQVPRRHVIEASSIKFDDKTLKEIAGSLMARSSDMSTTMAAMKLLGLAMGDPSSGRLIVPLFADEADTFGAGALLALMGYYNTKDEQFTLDASKGYRQGPKGRAIQVGISEAAAIAAFTAFGTAYAAHGVPMVPILTGYSKFLFPHVGNWIWSAGDSLARGFLFGATAGKTTLNGEGREHADGETPLIAHTHPHVHTFDPSNAYEVATIFLEGMKKLYGEGPRLDAIFNLMIYNEKFPGLARPSTATDEAIMKGAYLFASADETSAHNGEAHIIASGPIFHQAMKARAELKEDFNIGLNVWSGTNIGNLARDGEAVKIHNRLNPRDRRSPHLHDLFQGVKGTVIGATDYHPTYAGLLSGLFPEGVEYTALGAFGFGPSDRRNVLRRYQGVDSQTMVLEILQSFSRRGQAGITPERVDAYMKRHGFDRMRSRRDLVVL